MKGTLQRHIIYDGSVNPHPDHSFFLKRLDVNIAGIGIVRPEHQSIQQFDDWRIAVSLLIHVVQKGDVLCLLGRLISLSGRLPCGYFRVKIFQGLFQRAEFCQKYFQLHAGQLADILHSIKIQRVIHGNI